MPDPIAFPSPRFTVTRRIQREDGLDELELRLADETYGALTAALPATGTRCAMTASLVLPPEMLPIPRGATVGFTVITDPADLPALP